MSSRRPVAVLVAVFLGASLSVVVAGPARAATITVNTTDGGATAGNGCSLSEAITAANGNGPSDQCPAGSSVGTDTIGFNIPGDGPHTITPNPSLPLVGGNVIIDGTTEPGYVGAPLIELNGSSAGNNAAGLSLVGTGATVRALAINRFDGSGIVMGGDSNLVDSSYIGTDVTGNNDLGNRTGISVTGLANKIGNFDSSLPQFVTGDQYRNVISGNGTTQTGGSGIFVGQGSGVTIVRSNIGTTADGSASLGNSTDGVAIFGSLNNIIGSTDPVLHNIIGGNGVMGIDISNSVGPPLTLSTNNKVWGNYIGTNTQDVDLGNDGGGVSVSGSSNEVGGTADGQPNVIAYNGNASFFGRAGVIVRGTGQSVLGNLIFDNDKLGIDLGGDELTPNDEGDGDTGANDLQNFPVIFDAREIEGNARVSATIDSEPNTDYRFEYFESPACDNNGTGHGEGKAFLGFGTATTDSNGFDSLVQDLPVGLTPGMVLTATATKLVNGDPTSTSEFSQCFTVSQADMEVTKTGPSSVKVNKTFAYTIEVTNNGADGTGGVRMDDDLPAGVKLISVTLVNGEKEDGCTSVQRQVVCQLGTMGSGETVEIEIKAKLTAPVTVMNTAIVFADLWDEDESNNSASKQTTGTCDIKGNSKNNTLNGTPGRDVICGLGGKDTIFGKGGGDVILGGGANDTLKGQGGADALFGNSGRDSLRGGSGGDSLNGGPGSDACKQGPGSGPKSSCER